MSDPAALAYGWRDALVGRDPDAFAALFCVDALFLDVEHRTDDLAGVRPIVGREAIRALCTRWLAETPQFEYDVEQVLSEGTAAAVRWRYVVEGHELPGVSWLSCRGDGIATVHVYFDSLGLYRQLGRV